MSRIMRSFLCKHAEKTFSFEVLEACAERLQGRPAAALMRAYRCGLRYPMKIPSACARALEGYQYYDIAMEKVDVNGMACVSRSCIWTMSIQFDLSVFVGT